jgi:N-methylhydantoinase A
MSASAAPRFRIGCDIGGTFTDGVIMREDTGEFWITKTPSTPSDPSKGFANCLALLVEDSAARAPHIVHVFHGTTVATNAIIERQTARTGLITNDGFTDVLEIGRQQRAKLYDLQQEKNPPLVPGRWRLGVKGRVDAHGQELVALDCDGIRAAGKLLRQQEIESVAVCFLNSYRNARHEEDAAAILRKEYPDLYVSTSAEISPLFREFGRVSTTVVNAAVVPIVDRYLAAIERDLHSTGVSATLHIMQSNGGLIRSEHARKQPVNIIESGPAAGVIAAAFIGKLAGFDNVLAFDMGGTTAKVGLIKDGAPQIMPDYEVGATARTGQYETGAGYPVTLPVIDLVEVGAGGGSIAWVDSNGALKVGPRSAGADPGPACFALGGTKPTVTDAHLVLGRLNPDHMLGRRMTLAPARAKDAIESEIIDHVSLNLHEAALGILEIANANMLRALRLVSAVRGYDPRDYVVVAFGGAGPLHAGKLAEELDIPVVVVPRSPGVTCALGLLVTDVRHDYMRTCIVPTEGGELREVRNLVARLQARARDELAAEGFAPDRMVLAVSADLRYRGQAYELTVAAPSGIVDEAWAAELTRRFHEFHHTTYGHSSPGLPVEIVSLRVAASGLVPKPRLHEVEPATAPAVAALTGHRPVWFAAERPVERCPIYDRYALKAGHRFDGPAVVEEMDSTVVVYPGWGVEVDRFGNLIMRRTPGNGP